MPREKFVTLTEAMFYILICLQKECCGTDIMQQVHDFTEGRVRIGPGTLYNLLDQFLKNKMIQETSVQGRRKNYQINAIYMKFNTFQAFFCNKVLIFF